jgi:hypothetical protein
LAAHLRRAFHIRALEIVALIGAELMADIRLI